MPRYAITHRAGRFVAGRTNTGVGTVLELTARQAEHELRLGSLRALDTDPPTPEPEPTGTPAPRPARRRKAARAEPDRDGDRDAPTDGPTDGA